ncbi:hypothetical protein MASR1M74_19470 [Lentimicrobium sp.]
MYHQGVLPPAIDIYIWNFSKKFDQKKDAENNECPHLQPAKGSIGSVLTHLDVNKVVPAFDA